MQTVQRSFFGPKKDFNKTSPSETQKQRGKKARCEAKCEITVV